MLRQDYILRMAEQIGTTVAALIIKAEYGKGPKAAEECRDLCRQQIGLDLDYIIRLAPPSLLQLLQQAGQSWVGRSAGLVELLLGHARLAEAVADPQTAIPCYFHAYFLLREIGPYVGSDERGKYQEKLDFVSANLTRLGFGQLIGAPVASSPAPVSNS